MVRYYNENPREASLREEIQHLKEKNAESAKLIGELMHEINLQHDGRKMELELYEQWKREFDSERERVRKEMKDFNELPWFKKMCYKFKIKEEQK